MALVGSWPCGKRVMYFENWIEQFWSDRNYFLKWCRVIFYATGNVHECNGHFNGMVRIYKCHYYWSFSALIYMLMLLLLLKWVNTSSCCCCWSGSTRLDIYMKNPVAGSSCKWRTCKTIGLDTRYILINEIIRWRKTLIFEMMRLHSI